MIDLVTLVMILGATAYVVAPLLQKRDAPLVQQSQRDLNISELWHQHEMRQNTIDDLEFDHKTGKLSDADFQELVQEHRNAQAEVDRQLKDLSGISTTELRDHLEAEIAQEKAKLQADHQRWCPTCNHGVDPEDKFCSNCGQALHA